MHIKQGYHKRRRLRLLIPAIICSLQLFAQKTDSIYFSQNDTTYSFYGRFMVVAQADCVIHICFNYQHIKAMAPAASEIALIDEGENWNMIKYTYQLFPFKNESLWYRTIDPENLRVDFTLVSSKNNHSFMPQMISSSGYYRVRQLGGMLSVEYAQQCNLTRSFLTAWYLHAMKKKAVEFLDVFKNYSQKYGNSMD